MKRKPLSLKTKLASALLEMKRYDEEQAAFVPIIGYEESKSMTADQIVARFHFDHNIAHAHGGSDEPWNLTPMAIEDHRKKTAEIDVPRLAKSKRIQRRERGERKPRTITRWRKFNKHPVYASRDR